MVFLRLVILLVKGSGLPGRHVQEFLFTVFRTWGIQRRGDGKDCASLPPKEWGVRWASLAIFFLALGLGDFLHLGPPATCPCVRITRDTHVISRSGPQQPQPPQPPPLRSHFGSSGHFCSNGSLLQREPKVLLCSLTRMVLVSHGNVCRALLVSLLSWFGAVSALDSQFGFGSVCLEVPSFVEIILSLD